MIKYSNIASVVTDYVLSYCILTLALFCARHFTVITGRTLSRNLYQRPSHFIMIKHSPSMLCCFSKIEQSILAGVIGVL